MKVPGDPYCLYSCAGRLALIQRLWGLPATVAGRVPEVKEPNQSIIVPYA